MEFLKKGKKRKKICKSLIDDEMIIMVRGLVINDGIMITIKSFFL